MGLIRTHDLCDAGAVLYSSQLGAGHFASSYIPMKHEQINVNIRNKYFELRIKYQIEERSSQLLRNLSSFEKKD